MDDNTKNKNLVVEVAKAIGKVAGSVASKVGIHPSGQSASVPADARVDGRFVKKHKARLPRREKKAQRKKESHTHAAS